MPKAAHSLSSTPVMLATTEGDLGLCERQDCLRLAKQAANELKATVYIRDPISDRVLFEVSPEKEQASC